MGVILRLDQKPTAPDLNVPRPEMMRIRTEEALRLTIRTQKVEWTVFANFEPSPTTQQPRLYCTSFFFQFCVKSKATPAAELA